MQVEGVPALIHQTEVSWDATLDPAVYYKVGQVYEFTRKLEFTKLADMCTSDSTQFYALSYNTEIFQ